MLVAAVRTRARGSMRFLQHHQQQQAAAATGCAPAGGVVALAEQLTFLAPLIIQRRHASYHPSRSASARHHRQGRRLSAPHVCHRSSHGGDFFFRAAFDKVPPAACRICPFPTTMATSFRPLPAAAVVRNLLSPQSYSASRRKPATAVRSFYRSPVVAALSRSDDRHHLCGICRI